MLREKHQSQFISIPGTQGTIESQISNILKPKTGIILFAPYPPMGGTMSFSLIHDLFLASKSWVDFVCRFNYRGTSRSTGTFAENHDGVEDGNSVISYSLQKYPTLETLVLIGYSYGSAVSYQMHDKFSQIQLYVGISPPFDMFPKLFQPQSTDISKMFVVGDKDQFVALKEYNRALNDYNYTKQRVFPGIDHFWSDDSLLLVEIEEILKNLG